MDRIADYRRWFAAFEACVADDQWGRLEALLDPDAVYEVHGLPTPQRVVGRAAVIAGFARSIRGFDRRLAQRFQQCTATRGDGPDRVLAYTYTRYEHPGLPSLGFPCREESQWREGRLWRLTNTYEPQWVETAELFDWFGRHGPALGLDPSYA
ncbi:MAG TPA: nuclear transport factor 2 family protein [Nevskiaceae bacterium]|nr:nuclear transport factor 2 family protein [Nevskiaceae bacterium]